MGLRNWAGSLDKEKGCKHKQVVFELASGRGGGDLPGRHRSGSRQEKQVR